MTPMTDETVYYLSTRLTEIEKIDIDFSFGDLATNFQSRSIVFRYQTNNAFSLLRNKAWLDYCSLSRM